MNVLSSSTLAFWLFLLVFTIFSEITCREAIRPHSEVNEILEKIVVVNETVFDFNAPSCIVDVQTDLPSSDESQPLYIDPNTNWFWMPDAKGKLQVARGSSIELYCMTPFETTTQETAWQSLPKNINSIKPICSQGTTFLLAGEKFAFKEFICKEFPKYSVQLTTKMCADGRAQLYRVGFNISYRLFLETMQICHNDNLMQTHYTHHALFPSSRHFEKDVSRISFSKAGFFKDFDMNYLYTQANQEQQLSAVLGDSYTNIFNKRSLYLARGHLAAKADMIFANQQRSTFTFLNVAPQWQSFNGGQWATLEDEVRNFVAKMGITVDCYTGTWGIYELTAESGEKYPLYLTYDENNNGLLPVPKLYYRVIVDQNHPTRGIVLIGVNDPHITFDELNSTYMICTDIQEEVHWLRWIRNKNLQKGFLYACEVPDFISVVKDLPENLEIVTELLMAAENLITY